MIFTDFGFLFDIDEYSFNCGSFNLDLYSPFAHSTSGSKFLICFCSYRLDL